MASYCMVAGGFEDARVNGRYDWVGTFHGKSYYLKEEEGADDWYIYWAYGNTWACWVIDVWLIDDYTDQDVLLTMYFTYPGTEIEGTYYAGIGDEPAPTVTLYWEDAPLEPPKSVEYTPVADITAAALKLTVDIVNPATEIQCAIYRDSDKSLISTSVNAVAGVFAEERNVIFRKFEDRPVLLAGVKYYLVAWSSDDSGASIGIEATPLDGYDLITTLPLVYNNWPDPVVHPDVFDPVYLHYMIELSDGEEVEYAADIKVVVKEQRNDVYYADILPIYVFDDIYYADTRIVKFPFYYADVALDIHAAVLPQKIAVPAESATPVINNGVDTVKAIDIELSHDDIPDDTIDYQVRNWNASGSNAWSKWYPISDIDVWQLEPLSNSEEIPELKTVEVKYRISTTPGETPQEEEVGEEITSIEKYRWLDRFRNTTGGEVLNIVSYGNDIYIGAKIPYGNNFRGSIWKFNGKSFSFINYLEVSIGEDILNVYPYVMKSIGGSIYIGAGRDDDIEGAGVVYRYNEANGLILSSLLGSRESKVTALKAYMNNIYIGTKENRVYKYNTDTLWSLVFDLSFEDSYQGVSDIAVLNGIYISFYDGQNSYIYFYDDIALRKIYTLYNEHIYSMKVIPARYNDTGRYDLYLQTEDKIFRCAKEKTNESNSVYEQMQNAPNSPWLRSYIDLPGKTENGFNKILSAAIPMPGEVFPPTIVGKNGYIATFNDEKTIQISSGVAIDSNGDLVDLNDIEIVRPSNYYYIYGSSVNIDSEDNIYCSNSRTGVICKINTDGEVIHSLKTNNTTGADIAFTIGEDDDLIYVDKDSLKIVVLDKNFRLKKNISIDFIPNIFMTYNIYDKYLYITTEYQIKVYDLKQERVVRTIGIAGGGSGLGQFNNPMQITYDENHLYIVDRENNRIQKFDFSGEYVDSWGSSGSGNGQFNRPIGICVVGNYIYVSDYGNSRIQKFDKSGNFQSVLIISIGVSSGNIYHPKGLSVDSSGFIYAVERKEIAHTEINRIQQFMINGSFIQEYVRDAVSPPNDVSDNIGYIVGDNGVFLKSTDGGNTYAKVTPIGEPFGTKDLTSIAVNKNDINYIIVTDNTGIIYYSSDAGVTWGFHVYSAVSYSFKDCAFDPSSSDFSGAKIVGAYAGYPVIISLNSDASTATIEVSSATMSFSGYVNLATSVSFDNYGWLNNSHTNSHIYVVTTDAYWGGAGHSQALIYYDGIEWSISSVVLPVDCSDVYCYNNHVAIAAMNSVILSDNNGGSWHTEEMGETEWWKKIFYHGDSYFGCAIGNYYQTSSLQRPLQKSPVRIFSPNYENWPVYTSVTGTTRRYDDVIAIGTVSDTVAPDGKDYGYIVYSQLNTLYGALSYNELVTDSFVVIKDTNTDFYENRAYKIVDIDKIVDPVLASAKNKNIVLDEIPSGFANDKFNGKQFYIINSNSTKNSLIVNSPIGNTVVFGHRESGTKWYDYVNNTDGWVVEFQMALIDGVGVYATDVDAYQGVRIADGSKYVVLRIYKDKIQLLLDDLVMSFDSSVVNSSTDANFTNIFENSLTTDKLYIYTLRGWGNNIEVYIDGVKIGHLSGNLMQNSTSIEKSIEFGDLSGKDSNSCAKWSYVYYKTDKEFTYESEELVAFTDCTEVKKIFHTPFYQGYNFQENTFEEDFTNVLWAHNTANTPWVDSVSNVNGWIVEFVIDDYSPLSVSYERARIYDGTHGMEVRFYHGDYPYVVVIIGSNTYSFTSVGKSYNTVFHTPRQHLFRIEAKGAQVVFYIDNILIDELSGNILTNSTTQKYVDFGNNLSVMSGGNTAWGIIRYYLSSYYATTFGIYDDYRYQIYWTYVKETTSTYTAGVLTPVDDIFRKWFVIAQTDEPKVKMYLNHLMDNDKFSSIFSEDIFNPSGLRYYEDITEEISHVNDVVGFNYISGDTTSNKLLFAGRDTDTDDAITRMVRYGYAMTDVMLDVGYGYPAHYSDVYIAPLTEDKSNIVCQVYVVAQGRHVIQSKLYVFNSAVTVFFYKDYALTEPLNLYQGVSIADFGTASQKVYIKIVYYSPKETTPTVYVNQQGNTDATLYTERIDDYSFRAEYQLYAEAPDDYIDGFAAITVYS